MKKVDRITLTLGLALLLVLLAVGTVLAVHELGLFELDGNVADDAAGDDWFNVYSGTDSSNKDVLVFDDGIDGIDDPKEINYLGGGSKDDLDIPNWEWDTSPVPDKNDIMTAGAALYVDPATGDTIIYFFLDRFSSGTGDADVGFWFFEGTHNLVPSASDPTKGTFSGVHHVGDILVLSEFTSGGNVSTVKVFEWVGDDNGSETSTTQPAPGMGDGPLQLRYEGADCQNPDGTPKPGGDLACATVNAENDGTVIPPWNYTDKQGTGDYGLAALFEGGVNATELNLDIGCGGTFLANTRASQSTDARLHDFAIGDFDLCSIAVDKTGDTLSKVNDPADYSITITNDGAITLYKDDINDTLFSDLVINGVNQLDPNAYTAFDFATASPCGASLDPGDSCTIKVTRVVQAGDPDPLPNTVTVHYNNKSDFSDTDVSDSDDHSVNLFQPAVAAAKTGDALSKVGDDVNYTITLSNNSSADTPALTCAATDSLLGPLFSGVLPLGDTAINVSRTVQEGDPDPLVNTVTLTCSPEGFPNVLEASASHSVNLFQPAIAAAKTGDTLSKVGDDVNYTITLSNNSSADTPALDCTATDSLLGPLFSGALPLGDTAINVSRTVQEGDPDPLVNTVTLTCSPEGFPNVLEASASHSVNLFQPAIAAAKTGDTLSKVGDDVNYTITLSNNSSTDTHALTCTATDSLLGPLFSGVLPLGDTAINVSRTVQEGDPDPLVNTVTLTCSPAGFPNVLEASASHSVNLFQPAVAAAKTGDALSKVGDPVDYTITLSNNSSADTPALTCAATDSLLGPLFSGVLPLGDTVINVSRTVQPGDPDPLVNTVTLTCSPAGFPNVLEASASHSTNLFQPAVEVIKTGPDTATRGETITYFFTINNLSSADSPDLVLVSMTDTVLGDLTAAAAAGGCSTLASGGSCSFTFDYTIQFDDPSPLCNVVTVHYNPFGFPNDISDDDDHCVLIPIQGCTPGFWQGGAGAPLWDVPMDQDWFDGGYATPYNPYDHNTLFNDFFNMVTDPRLDGYTMYQLVGSGGGSDPAIKAARDMVAAYLNESAFPTDFPASSLADLLTMWYDAVTGGDAALAAFHNTVSGWNNPAPPGYCPLP